MKFIKWGEELWLKVLNLPIKRYWHFQYSRTFWEEQDVMKNLISFSLLQNLQEISAKLQVRSSLTYLDICYFMIAPLRKTIVRKKWSRAIKFYQIKLLSFTTSLPYSLCSLMTAKILVFSQLPFRTS